MADRSFPALIVLFILMCQCAAAVGQEPISQPRETAVSAQRGLTAIDWSVIALYGVGMLALGAYTGRRQKSTRDYFLAGGRMNSFVVGISMVATLISTISYLANPGEVIKHGPVLLIGIIGTGLGYFLVSYWLVPALMKRQVISAYTLLEDRLGSPGRIMASLIFIALRLMWMTLMLHLASEALLAMLGLPVSAKPWIIVITGAVAVTYTALGGLKAVIITDAIQFMILLGGAALTIALVTLKMGGFGWFPTEWAPHWDTQPIFSFDPHVRRTVVGEILAIAMFWVCTAGADQVLIQRFMATPNVRAARRAFLVNCVADIVIVALLCVVGMALLGFYTAHPELVAGEGGMVEQADKLFPQFIANQLPVGISGLVVVALFAAAMSSMDSGINSVTAVVTTEYLVHSSPGENSQAHDFKLARWLTLGIGVAIVLLNTVIEKVPGNFIEKAARTLHLMVAPLFSLFFMAFFVRFATPYGAIWGAIYGFSAAVLVAYWHTITGLEALSIQLIGLTALVCSVLAGMFWSLMPTRDRKAAVLLSWCVVAAIPLAAAVVWAVFFSPGAV